MCQQKGLHLDACDGGWTSRGVGLEVSVAHWGCDRGRCAVGAIGTTVFGCGSIARFERR